MFYNIVTDRNTVDPSLIDETQLIILGGLTVVEIIIKQIASLLFSCLLLTVIE